MFNMMNVMMWLVIRLLCKNVICEMLLFLWGETYWWWLWWWCLGDFNLMNWWWLI